MEFFNAQVFHNLSCPVASNDTALLGSVLAAMCTAMAARAQVSAAVSTSGYGVEIITEVIRELRQLGYGVSETSTPGSLIVSW